MGLQYDEMCVRKSWALSIILLSTSSSSGWNGSAGISSCQLTSDSSVGRAASRGILTRQSQIGHVYLSSSLTLPQAIFKHLPWYLGARRGGGAGGGGRGRGGAQE